MLMSVLVAISMLMIPVSAADFVSSFKQCAAEKDSLNRLLCYDKLAKVLNHQQVDVELPDVPVATSKSPGTVSTARTLEPASTEDEFGAKYLKNDMQEAITQVSYMIKSVDKTLRGLYRFTFENGQKWEQQESDIGIRFRVGETVIIKRGVLDSFYLKGKNSNRTIQVKRIK